MHSLILSGCNRFARFGLLVVMCLTPLGCDSKPTPVVAKWLKSWDTAVAESKETGKPILIDFTGKNPDGRFWCPPCEAMHDRVFISREFAEWATENVVLYEAESPRSEPAIPEVEKLKTEYGIRGLPTFLFLHADGTEIVRGHYEGRSGAEWVRMVGPTVKAARRPKSGNTDKEGSK